MPRTKWTTMADTPNWARIESNLEWACSELRNIGIYLAEMVLPIERIANNTEPPTSPPDTDARSKLLNP